MKNRLIFSLLALIIAYGNILAQETFQVPLRDKTSPDNVYAETLPEGVMLLVRHFQSFEMILLDNNFQVQKSAFLENEKD